MVGAFLERERLQAAATAAAAAREADRLKSSLLSSVSHELKTPLAALTATVSNLLESDVDWDEESVRDELRAIVGDLARLNSSIGALLDLSRLEADAWEPRRELYELGDDRRRRHRHAARAPARARARGAARRGPRRRRRLRPVRRACIQNLLENALLYADGRRSPWAPAAGTKACASGSRTKDQASPPTNTKRCSRSSTAAGGRAERAPSGTGLGLAIAREIVRSHGGTHQRGRRGAARRTLRDHAARRREPARPEKEESA